ncbi:MAG: YaiO family outer membrane beta-barrel protein [Bacteroidales bacterium]
MDYEKKHPDDKIPFIRYFLPAFLLIHLYFGVFVNILYGEERSLPEQLQEARQLAYDQETQEARKIAYDILSQDPDYHDARVLIGRTLIWDEKHDSARTELKTVYEKMPTHYDCIHALIDLERWSDNFTKALEYANHGLEYYPNDVDMLYKKADILAELGENEPASETLERLLTIKPGHKKGNVLYKDLNPGLLKQAGVVHRFSFFRKPWVKRWHVTSLRADLNLKNSLFIGMINYGRLVGSGHPYVDNPGKVNLQFQLDGYPRITPSDYLYLNLAYSGSPLFPEQRYAAEWFHNFDKGYELSGGFRGLKWNEPIFFYTGSAGLYFRDYWFALRTYITPEERATGHTYTLRARRYLATSDDYIGLKLEYGTSPESLAYAVDFEELNRLNTTGIHLEYQENIKHWLIKLGLIYRNEEFMDNNFRDHIITELRIMYQFYN